MAIIICLIVFFISLLSVRKMPLAGLVVFVCAGFACGFFLSTDAVERARAISPPMETGRTFICRAVVLEAPRIKEWGTGVDVRLHECRSKWERDFRPAYGGVRLSTRQKDAGLEIGDRVSFMARFTKPREFKNPGAFSNSKYLMVHGLSATAWALGRIRVEGEKEGVGIARLFARARGRIEMSMNGRLRAPELAVVEALALGKRDGVTSKMRETLAFAGVSHLLAISGLHVGLVAVMLYFVSRLIFGLFPGLFVRVPLQRIAAAITIPAMWCYVMLTGSAMSAVRAGLMLSVFLVGVLAGRRQDLLTTLAIAVVMILFLMPLSVLDVSFQLSVISVLGIILISPRLIRAFGGVPEFSPVRKARAWFLAMLSVSIAATLSALPLVAYYFKIVTPLGIFTNLIAVPMAAILLVPSISLASVIALVCPGWAWPFWKAAGLLSGLLLHFFEFVASRGGALVFHFAPTPMEVILLYSILALVVFWKRFSYKRIGVLVVCAVLIMDVSYWRIFPMVDNKLRIDVLDVGQGDSMLVRFPGGKSLLVDGGGVKHSDFDIGKNVVAPALWRLGVHRLDFALLTHPHHDHYRGLGYIAGEFRPKLIWTNGLAAPVDEIDDWDLFLSQVNESGVPMEAVGREGFSMDVGGAEFRVINPPWEEGEDLNDSSLVVDIKYGDTRFLSMGDLAGIGEKRLLALKDDMSSDVLKIGHHGAADAATGRLLGAAGPKYVIISVGANNKYGSPDAKTLRRIEKSGARVYRTDRDGMISVVSDGHAVNIEALAK